MPRTTIGSRWVTPSRRYTGSWRDNPWINATLGISSHDSLQAPREAVDARQDRQGSCEVITWENEGGSLGAPPDRQSAPDAAPTSATELVRDSPRPFDAPGSSHGQ